MLSLAKAHKDYYLRKLGEISPGEDYYLRGGSATGAWRGNGAEELGLEGSVSAEGLVRLFVNPTRPSGWSDSLGHPQTRRWASWFTVSATKPGRRRRRRCW